MSAVGLPGEPAELATPLAAATLARVPSYEAEQVPTLVEFLARCERLARPGTLPFHGTGWLRAWYQTLGATGGRTPLLLAVRLQPGGPDAALLPLVVSRRAGLRVVAWADADVVDYNAPILARQWHGGATPTEAAPALWRAIRQGLAGCDVLQIDKLLGQCLDETPAAPSPLLQCLSLEASDLFGNQFSAPEGWEAWRRTLDKTVRKEIERCWRVFERSPAARFEQVRGVPEALALFDLLDQQQAERARQLGLHYKLDQPEYRAFYRALVAGGVADGSVVMTALRDGDAVVSAMLGVANAQRYVALRQSIGGAAWKNASPGRLLDDGTARHLHGQGLTQFDFGIGDYHHKSALKMQHIPLYAGCVPLSWRGVPVAALWRARRWLKARPALRALWLQRLKPLLKKAG